MNYNKIITGYQILFLILAISFSPCFAGNNLNHLAVSENPDRVLGKHLLKAYAKYIAKIENNLVYWKDGSTQVWDDHKKKNFDEMVENPVIEDMLSQSYITGEKWQQPPPTNFSPGRIRNEQFFKKIYGESESAVQKKNRSVKWFGKKIPFNKENGAADSLEAVEKDLQKLSPELKKYVSVTMGTFNWRKIRGAKQLSPHSFAIAMDINTAYANYWRDNGITKYKNRIPYEIVKIFEKHGFVWGGKWYHFDTMHFEFRPEFFIN